MQVRHFHATKNGWRHFYATKEATFSDDIDDFQERLNICLLINYSPIQALSLHGKIAVSEEKGSFFMLKILVLDGGYGGELFADLLESELPIAEVIRVIDWRNANSYQDSPRAARKAALRALKPYIGRVDLIVFANYLLAETSLNFFQNQYQDQKFTGLKLPLTPINPKQPALMLTTKNFTRTISHYKYLFRLKHRVKTICLDTWPNLIDDGELSSSMIERELEKFFMAHQYYPTEIILTCSQFRDIIPELRRIIGKNTKIHDNFNSTVLEICKILKIRGKTGKKSK